MPNRPLVSVVVPSFNSEAFIGTTISSILAQDFAQFELIISDHSSTDNTLDIVSQFADDSRIRVIRCHAGGGADRNWNSGTFYAQGRYLKLVPADDYLYPTCLSRQLKAIERSSEIVLVASRRDIVDMQGRVVLPSRGLAGISGETDGASAIRQSVRWGGNLFGEPACTLLRTELVRQLGGWSSRRPYVIDLDLYIRVLERGRLYAVDESLAAFRLSSLQWSVALQRHQARSTVALISEIGQTRSDISASDVAIGSTRAYGRALARRVGYRLWAKRMRAALA